MTKQIKEAIRNLRWWDFPEWINFNGLKVTDAFRTLGPHPGRQKAPDGLAAGPAFIRQSFQRLRMTLCYLFLYINKHR